MIRKLIVAIIVFFMMAIPGLAANKFYWATGLTGGGAALDGIDGAGLTAGDSAIVVLDSGTNVPIVYIYRLQASSASEASPTVIVPNTNAGTSAWHLAGVRSTTLSLNAAAGNYATVTSASQGTANINIDGVSYTDYNYSNGASTATYTPVITAPPASGFVRYITLTIGGGAGVVTLTATNITWIGTAGAAVTTTNKKSTYACIIPESGSARCSIVAEAY
jgi:hypothetical protein